MRTLIVDDDLTSRLVLEDILSRYGTVHACEDGGDAVAAVRRELERGAPYDLICMDIMMPKMSGIEALQMIRAAEAGVDPNHRSKVIMITGSEDAGFVSQAFHQFCDAYIVKPVDTEAFLGVLECVYPIPSVA